MATTKEKIKEANLVDEQVAQEQAQPATSTEVADAQQNMNQQPVDNVSIQDTAVENGEVAPTEEAPVEEAPVEEVVPEESVEEPRVTVDGDEVEIPATIEIKTQDLGASVAMVTGDTEPAELSPDVAESEPLVQDEEIVPEPDMTTSEVEPSNDNLEVENLEKDDEIKLESLTARELDMIKEYRKYREENEVNSAKASEEANKEEPTASDSAEEEGKGAKEPFESADKPADEAKKAAEDSKPKHKDINVSIKESEEDKEDLVEEIPEIEPVEEFGGEQEPVNLDMLADVPNVNEEDDAMLDAFNEDPEGMSLDSIASFLKGVEKDAEEKVVNVDNEIKDATSQMQKSIDYLNSLLSGSVSSYEDEPLEDEIEDTLIEEPMGDEVRELVDVEVPEEYEDEDYKESCKKSVREPKEKKLNEATSSDKSVYFKVDLEEIICNKWEDMYKEPMDEELLNEAIQYAKDCLSESETLWNAIDECVDGAIFAVEEEYRNWEKGMEYEEKVKRIPVSSGKKNPFTKIETPEKRTLKPRVQESYAEEVKEASVNIKYPAGSKPLENNSDNLVKTYEESARRKREALANFREAMRTSKKTEERQLDEKFVEALHTPSKMNVTCEDKKSWSNNRIDESQEKLSFNSLKRMLENGFLG